MSEHYNVALEAKDMLILTRGLKQTLLIGDEVTVTVLDIKGDRVRIGIHAPYEVEVQRRERLDKLKPYPPTQP
jgi:carbon storage regulator